MICMIYVCELGAMYKSTFFGSPVNLSCPKVLLTMLWPRFVSSSLNLTLEGHELISTASQTQFSFSNVWLCIIVLLNRYTCDMSRCWRTYATPLCNISWTLVHRLSVEISCKLIIVIYTRNLRSPSEKFLNFVLYQHVVYDQIIQVYSTIACRVAQRSELSVIVTVFISSITKQWQNCLLVFYLRHIPPLHILDKWYWWATLSIQSHSN